MSSSFIGWDELLKRHQSIASISLPSLLINPKMDGDSVSSRHSVWHVRALHSSVFTIRMLGFVSVYSLRKT